MRIVWYVAIGSALGGAARYLLGGLVQARLGAEFPYGTLVVNVTGSFLLGLLQTYALGTTSVSPELRALLTLGFCGGYTTFSTFSYETIALVRDGEAIRAGAYLVLSAGLAIAGAVAGIALGAGLLRLERGV